MSDPSYIILSESLLASVAKDAASLGLAAVFTAIDATYIGSGGLALFCLILSGFLIGAKAAERFSVWMGWRDTKVHYTHAEFIEFCRRVSEQNGAN